jgi:hypothetical protein
MKSLSLAVMLLLGVVSVEAVQIHTSVESEVNKSNMVTIDL